MIGRGGQGLYKVIDAGDGSRRLGNGCVVHDRRPKILYAAALTSRPEGTQLCQGCQIGVGSKAGR